MRLRLLLVPVLRETESCRVLRVRRRRLLVHRVAEVYPSEGRCRGIMEVRARAQETVVVVDNRARVRRGLVLLGVRVLRVLVVGVVLEVGDELIGSKL